MSLKAIAYYVLSCVLFLLSLNTWAAEKSNAYFGLQYSQLEYSTSGLPDIEPTALVARIGSYSSENMAIEFRFGVGLDKGTATLSDPWLGTWDLSLDLDNLIGLYAVGHAPMGSNSSLYVLLGYTQIDATSSISNGSLSASGSDKENDMSMGIGLNLGLGEALALNVEYTSYLSKSDYDLNAFNMGIRLDF